MTFMEVLTDCLKPYLKITIVFHFVDMKDVVEVELMINENTKLIWVETPTILC